MKTKFVINSEIFLDNGGLEECFKIYEAGYKDDGYILDKEYQEVYFISEKEFNLNVGDRIILHNDFKIIESKCVDIINDIIIYDCVQE